MSRIFENMVIVFSWLCGICLTGIILSITGYIFVSGIHTLDQSLVFGDTDPLAALLLRARVFDGLFSAILGTLLLVIVSVAWAIPIGVATGIYMAEYAGSSMKKYLNFCFDILAGIPSIVIGLFGFSLAVFLHKHFSDRIYPCFLISTLSLAFLVLPYIIRTTQVCLESFPSGMRITALALGATKLQNIFFVLIPQSLSGIFSGVILAIGRCAEDTAVIMLTGVVVSAGIPKSFLASYEALPFYIYYVSSQYSDTQELMTGYGASIILVLLCVFLFFIAFLIRKHLTFFAFYRA